MLLEEKKTTTKELKREQRWKMRSDPAAARVYIRFLKRDERQAAQKYM
jgi:hypothetical protein